MGGVGPPPVVSPLASLLRFTASVLPPSLEPSAVWVLLGPAVAVELAGAALDVAAGPGLFCSSRKKLGPDPTTGVAKFKGLGRVLLSVARKFQSG